MGGPESTIPSAAAVAAERMQAVIVELPYKRPTPPCGDDYVISPIVCMQASALRSARLPVNLIGSPINYANRLIGAPINSANH